jgi:hypothetical protein
MTAVFVIGFVLSLLYARQYTARRDVSELFGTRSIIDLPRTLLVKALALFVAFACVIGLALA